LGLFRAVYSPTASSLPSPASVSHEQSILEHNRVISCAKSHDEADKVIARTRMQTV
jgi:hypothetical protein